MSYGSRYDGHTSSVTKSNLLPGAYLCIIHNIYMHSEHIDRGTDFLTYNIYFSWICLRLFVRIYMNIRKILCQMTGAYDIINSIVFAKFIEKLMSLNICVLFFLTYVRHRF